MAQLVEKINEKSIYAARSEADENGLNISTGYQKKLTAGTNITIDPVTNTISSTGGSGGKTYTGVAPVVVDNTQDKISVNSTDLIAGDNITITEGTDSITVNVNTNVIATKEDLANKIQVITDPSQAEGKTDNVLYILVEG